MCGGRRSRAQYALDPIEDSSRHTIFALQRDRFVGLLAHNRHGVGIDVEAPVGLRHIVGNDQIDTLAHAFLARLPEHVVGLGGEPDEHRSGATCGGAPRTEIAEVNQWVRQYITNMVPELELFWRYPVGNGTIGIGTGQ